MKSNYKRLGQYIRQVDVRNTEGKEENLLGVSVQKKFIPSIANTVGTDFTKYKVVKKGQFTYIPDTSRRGDKIGIALLDVYKRQVYKRVAEHFRKAVQCKYEQPSDLLRYFGAGRTASGNRHAGHFGFHLKQNYCQPKKGERDFYLY